MATYFFDDNYEQEAYNELQNILRRKYREPVETSDQRMAWKLPRTYIALYPQDQMMGMKGPVCVVAYEEINYGNKRGAKQKEETDSNF